MEPTTMWT